MTDDVNKKIIIDIEVNNDGQKVIDQYTSAINNLKSNINNLDSPLKNLSANINILGKNISQVSASGEESQNKISGVTESFIGWNDVIKIINKTLTGWGMALSAGISILITYGPEILKWIGNLLKGNTTLTALTKTLKDNKLVMDAVNQATLQGSQNAQEELVHLKLLYIASQNHNLSLKDRKKAVIELQNQYPQYFGNLSQDTILTGKATKAYQDLTTAIIASAKAKAAEEMMVNNSKRQLGNDDELKQLNAQLITKKKELQQAQKDYNDVQKAMESAGSSNSFGTPTEDTAGLVKLNRIQGEYDDLRIKISHLNTDSEILTRRNTALSNLVMDNIKNDKKDGLNILTGIQSAELNNATLTSTQNNQKFGPCYKTFFANIFCKTYSCSLFLQG